MQRSLHCFGFEGSVSCSRPDLKGHRRSLPVKRRVLCGEEPAHEGIDDIFIRAAMGTPYRPHGSATHEGVDQRSQQVLPEVSRRRAFGLTVLAPPREE
jgi:hypothetical protein